MLETEELYAVVSAVATSLVTLAAVGLTTNLAEAVVTVSSWARTILAKGIIMMEASRRKTFKVEISITSEWAEFERGMMTEGRRKREQ